MTGSKCLYYVRELRRRFGQILEHTVSSWLRHCTTSRTFADSIPDGVTGILYGLNPLKTERICFIYGLSAYRAVNTLHFGYKNQSLNVL
jgi:hypothetical protein